MVGGHGNRAGLVVLVAISAVDCAAHSMNSLGPFAVGELVRGGRFSIMQAGVWSSVEMLAYAVAMTAVAPLSARLRLRFVAVLAAVGLVGAQAGSAFVVGLWPLLVLRVLSGGCLGGLNAVVNIGASRLGRPVFVLSFVMVVQTVVFSLASLLLPHASAIAGQRGVFLALAGLVVLLLPFMFFLPDTNVAHTPAPPQARYATPPGLAHVWALLAVLFYTGGSLAVWPFTQRIGASVGLAPASFGVLSAIANIAGLAVCLVTVVQSRRHNTSPFLVPALVLVGGVCVVQACPPAPMLFCAAFVLNYAVWFFIYPSLVGLTCLVDPTGKLAARSGGAWMFSQAGTTLFASATQTNGLYLWTGLFSLCLCLCAAFATLRVTRPHTGSPALRPAPERACYAPCGSSAEQSRSSAKHRAHGQSGA